MTGLSPPASSASCATAHPLVRKEHTVRYATTTDLQAEPWSIAPVPPQAPRLLALASAAVRSATKTAHYAVDADGMPQGGSPAANAMRDATCAQVATWLRAGVDPTTPQAETKRVTASKSLGSASFSYADAGAQLSADAQLRSGELGTEALTLLDAAGLLNGPVQVFG